MCGPYCLCIARFGLTLGVSALQLLFYITLHVTLLNDSQCVILLCQLPAVRRDGGVSRCQLPGGSTPGVRRLQARERSHRH